MNYFGCDRDFFIFHENGTYEDFVIPDSGCIPETYQLQWSFEKGVLKLSNSFKDFDEMVVTELTSQKFIFKVRYDVDEDGTQEIIRFLAKPYQPDEKNFYVNTIFRDEDYPDRIRFKWNAYSGLNTFDRYEIYRINSADCNLSKSQLIKTITDIEETNFTDENPPLEESFCYYLKIYTNKGLLFETYPQWVDSGSIEVPGVSLNVPTSSGNTISLQWEKYEGYFFKQYEVVVQNYHLIYGGGTQETVLAIIDDINTTSFVDTNPPYYKNPVYKIRIRNQYERINTEIHLDPSIQRSDFKRPEILDVESIYITEIDPTESIIYINGEQEDNGSFDLLRYNYLTHEIESIADRPPGVNQNRSMRVVESSAGKEILYPSNDELLVYNANTLQFKYKLGHNDINQIHDFIHLGGNQYIVLDREYVYSFTRDFGNLSMTDKSAHNLSPYQNYTFNRIFKFAENKVLVGGNNSYVYEIEPNGMFGTKIAANIPIVSNSYKNNSAYSPSGDYLINYNENRLYSTVSLDYLSSYEQPYYTTGITNDGQRVLGANHQIDYSYSLSELQEKQAVIYTLQNGSIQFIDTKGYPLLIFENHLGQIISLSSGVPRPNLESWAMSPNLFFEIIGQ